MAPTPPPDILSSKFDKMMKKRTENIRTILPTVIIIELLLAPKSKTKSHAQQQFNHYTVVSSWENVYFRNKHTTHNHLSTWRSSRWPTRKSNRKNIRKCNKTNTEYLPNINIRTSIPFSATRRESTNNEYTTKNMSTCRENSISGTGSWSV